MNFSFGEVSERFKEHAWKACVRKYRGFESRPLRTCSRCAFVLQALPNS